mmetsp:Transcript_5999/g.18940  ORF Transcript_5999/g.18940 Transcript_5999/m.18940 type:complete len:207 (-) Transcript_5999:1140-1760(-)
MAFPMLAMSARRVPPCCSSLPSAVTMFFPARSTFARASIAPGKMGPAKHTKMERRLNTDAASARSARRARCTASKARAAPMPPKRVRPWLNDPSMAVWKRWTRSPSLPAPAAAAGSRRSSSIPRTSSPMSPATSFAVGGGVARGAAVRGAVCAIAPRWEGGLRRVSPAGKARNIPTRDRRKGAADARRNARGASQIATPAQQDCPD